MDTCSLHFFVGLSNLFPAAIQATVFSVVMFNESHASNHFASDAQACKFPAPI